MEHDSTLMRGRNIKYESGVTELKEIIKLRDTGYTFDVLNLWACSYS
jgi:hypothetical protein